MLKKKILQKFNNTVLLFYYLDFKCVIPGIKLLFLHFFYYIYGFIVNYRAACNLLKNTEVVLSINKIKFSIHAVPNDLGYIFENFIRKSYESLEAFIPEEGDTCLDIGSNIGDCALSWYIKNSTGRIICCEPHPDTYKRLQKNISLNGCSNIETLQVAISNKNDSIEIPVDFISSMITINSSKKQLTCTVETLTLDRLLEEKKIEKIDLCKIDVEGHEVEVLRGATEPLKKIEKLIIECHSYAITQEVKKIINPYFLIVQETGTKTKLMFAKRKD